MSKKKRNKKSVGIYFLLVILLAAIVTLGMLFLPAVIDNADKNPTSYKGFEVAFGKELGSVKIGSLINGVTKINFSILAVLAYVLPLVFALVALVMYALKGSKGRQIIALLGIIVFVFSAVILFIIPNVTSLTMSQTNILTGSSSTTYKFTDLDYKFTYSIIIGGVSSAIGALASAGYLLKK